MKPEGVIVQLGGQTPLNLAKALRAAGWRILGTPYEAIDRAEDRKKFNALVEKLDLLQPPGGTALTVEEARDVAARLGYPVLVRPSYVLGGRAMEIVYDPSVLERFVHQALDASPGHPVLIDKFIEDAVEVDVDSVSDGTETVIGGILEHVEEAGTHSGDAGMVLPPYSLPPAVVDRIRACTHALAKELGVVGLMNVQYAVKGSDVYILEVNPRASRTVPFVSKAIGVPLAKVAAQVMVGKTLHELGVTREIVPPHVSMKESVFPFKKFPGSDIILGPEMKSTGEVMGIDADFAAAYAKAQMAASHLIPTEGKVFISLADADKADAPALARRLLGLGFGLCATEGTARVLAAEGLPVQVLRKMREGRPNPRDAIINKEISLVVNTPSGKGPKTDEAQIRAAALAHGVTVITAVRGALAAADAIATRQRRRLDVKALQDYHPHLAARRDAVAR
jgi:carbamoyl-phosphate synthase large subunit